MINGAWDVLELLFVIFVWIETKGKTLEEIDAVIDGVKHSDMPDLDSLKKGDEIEQAATEVLVGTEPTADAVDPVLESRAGGTKVDYKESTTERRDM
jgi:hypothetical protein